MASNPFISRLCDEKSFFKIFKKDLKHLIYLEEKQTTAHVVAHKLVKDEKTSKK